MFCSHCGKQIPDNADFCSYCGSKTSIEHTNAYDGSVTLSAKMDKSKMRVIAPACALIVITILVFFFVIIPNKNENSFGKTVKSLSDASVRDLISYGKFSQPDNMRSSAASPERQSKDYVLEYSSTRKYTDEEIKKLSKDELRIARNEIYARRGRKFKDAELQNYFNSKPWYHGTIEPDKFNDNSLSDIEKKNRDLIQKYENKSGS